MARAIEWIETATQYIAVLQPLELFDENSFFEDRHGSETIIVGLLKNSEELDWYAHAYDKEWVTLEQARAWVAAARNVIPAPQRQSVQLPETIMTVYEDGIFRLLEKMEGLQNNQRVRLQIVSIESAATSA